VINLGLLTYADEQFGVRDSFEEFLKSRFGGSMKEFLKDRKKVAQLQRTEILLAGRVEIPNLICQKGMRFDALPSELSGSQFVPLAVKNFEGV
jgi:hypothetical protein